MDKTTFKNKNVLVVIAKKKFKMENTLYEILQVLSISIFEKTKVNQLFRQTQLQYFKEQDSNQLNMFNSQPNVSDNIYIKNNDGQS